MAEGEGTSGHGAERSWEALYRSQLTLEQRLESLAVEFQKFAMEIRRELRALKGNRDTTPIPNPAIQRIPPFRGEVTTGAREPRGLPRNGSQAAPETHAWVDEVLNRRTYPTELSDSDEEPAFGELTMGQTPIPTQGMSGDHRLKLDLPCFDGHLHIEDYLDWEQAVEAFFDYMDVAPERQVKFVACKLIGGAAAWWVQLVQTRKREGKGAIRSWGRMKQLLCGHFLPSDYEQLLYLQYQRCRQGSKTVSEYTEEFYRLSARNNLNETPQQLIARYVGGLKDAIHERLELNSIWSLSQAVNFAYKVELQLNRNPKSFGYR